MAREAFEQEVLRRLKAHHLRMPAMQQADEVKFVFQAMLGVGHLLSSRENITGYIISESSELAADPAEPLFEILSPAWCRLNLRRTTAERIRPQDIAGMMLASSCVLSFRQRDGSFVLFVSDRGTVLLSCSYNLRGNTAPRLLHQSPTK